MSTLHQLPTRGRTRVGVVSESLLLTHSARRIAARLRMDPAPIERCVVSIYRSTGDAHRSVQALRDLAATATGASA